MSSVTCTFVEISTNCYRYTAALFSLPVLPSAVHQQQISSVQYEFPSHLFYSHFTHSNRYPENSILEFLCFCIRFMQMTCCCVSLSTFLHYIRHKYYDDMSYNASRNPYSYLFIEIRILCAAYKFSNSTNNYIMYFIMTSILIHYVIYIEKRRKTLALIRCVKTGNL